MLTNDYLIENARCELLREAKRFRKHMCKIRDGAGEVVKVRHKYSSPDEYRQAYVDALDSLVKDGLVLPVMHTRELDLFELANDGNSVTTLSDAKQIIVSELGKGSRVYKIHSDQGEYLLIADCPQSHTDDERVLFLSAFSDLVHHGIAEVIEESRELSIIALAPSRTKELTH